MPGGNSIKLKQFILQTLSDSNFQLNQDKITDILRSLGNNENKFASLTQNEIDILTKILSLKNADFHTNTNV